eukprot:CAMPEP_0197577002 /NCGR_PEP_ID=MMETSP1326-20131121/1789_1 /TAXON_ID=1155430 /ORGANISM="Genus nov. species nov., Strain RCC2288" /LENGTH=1233 /DNA_ID=CAMNT_0043139993 /DNA_START=914 /DNA_END=4615 /DNA_ORIENTATION=+
MDENSRWIDLDLPYEVTPNHWYSVYASFLSESFFLLSVDNSAYRALESSAPKALIVPKYMDLFCSTCGAPFRGNPHFEGRVANIFMSTGVTPPPLSRVTTVASSFAERLDMRRDQGDAENTENEHRHSIKVLLVSRAAGASTGANSHDKIVLALQALCSNTPSNVRAYITDIIVDSPTMKLDHHVAACKLLRVTFADLSPGSWVQRISDGVRRISNLNSADAIVVADWDLLFTTSTLSGLMAVLTEHRRTVTSSIITDLHSNVLVAGYDFAWQPLVDADYILPVQQHRGYPHMHSRIGLKRHASTLSGHVFAFRYKDLKDLLPSYQALEGVGGADIDISPVLVDADFFLQLDQAGLRTVLAKESLAVSVSNANDVFLTDASLNMDGAVAFASRWQKYLSTEVQKGWKVPFGVRWMMHCAGSMGGEALAMISGLEGHVPLRTQITRPIPYCEHYAENINTAPIGLRQLYTRLHQLGPQSTPEVIIYHRDYRVFGELVRGIKTTYNIGRYMFEGNGTLHKAHVDQMHALDEIWVPSQFHKQVITMNGIPSDKVAVIPEAVDVELLQLTATRHHPLHIHGEVKPSFKFLSVFKMEDRKGWRELVEGYCAAFSSSDAVLLVLHTYIYGDSDGWNPMKIHGLISAHLDKVKCKKPQNRPKIHITGRPFSSVDLIRLYKGADAYVSAHWGEGWGLPLSEAMSMGLPTIATDFSGNTEFMSHENSFLVPVAKSVPYVDADEWFGGMQHAEVDIEQLNKTFQYIFMNQREARRRGKLGQQTMEQRYTPSAVADAILKRLKIVELKLKRVVQKPVVHSQHFSSPLRSTPGFVDVPEVQVCSSDIDIDITHRNMYPPIRYAVTKIAPTGKPRKVVIISTYPPRPCGIAMFTKNLVNGMLLNPGIIVEVIALTKDVDHYKYPKEVTRTIRQNIFNDYLDAAEYINESDFDAVYLQHEFGIYGPRPCGGYVICLARYIKPPLFTTVHTVLTRLSDQEGSIIQLLHLLSTRMVVMTTLSKKMLEGTFFVSERVVVIPHGAPDVHLQTHIKTKVREQMNWNGRLVVIANGLIHRGKGYEYMIQALPGLVKLFPNILFCVVGQPHPNSPDTTIYLNEITMLAKELGVQTAIRFLPTFFSFDELERLLVAADIFIAPYTDDSVSSSGTLTMAMAAGLPCVATPFVFSKIVFIQNRGIMIKFNDRLSIERVISTLALNSTVRQTIGQKAWRYMQNNTWQRVGLAYLNEIE